MSVVTPDSWLVAASAAVCTAALNSLLVYFVMGYTEVLLRLQSQLLFQNCNFLFGHMSRPDSLLFQCVFPSMFSPTQLRFCWSGWHDGYGFPLGIHLEMQIASSQSRIPPQTPARAPVADKESQRYNIYCAGTSNEIINYTYSC